MSAIKILFPFLLLVSVEVSCALTTFGKVVPGQSTTPTPVFEEDHDLERTLHQNLTSDPLVKLMRPFSESGPTEVRTNVYIRDIRIKVLNPEDRFRKIYDWTADITFRQRWNDPRLKFDKEGNHPEYKYFALNSVKKIWSPDLFFPESVKGDFHLITAPNELVWIYPNGDILYSIRISVELRCQKSVNSASPNLECPMRVASYGYTADKIDLKWDVEPRIEFRNDLYISGFELLNVTTLEGVSKTRSGDFATVSAVFQFKPDEH